MDSTKELYSSLVLDSYIKLIKERYPEVLIDELMSYAGIENYELGDHSVWFTQEQVNRFHRKLSTLTDNMKIAREAGRFAAHAKCLGEVRGMILLQGGIFNTFKLIGKYAKRLNRSSVYTTRAIGRHQIEITVKPNPGVTEKEFQCQNRLGNFEGIADLFSHKDLEITHPQCLFKGDDVCRYVISWKISKLSILSRLRWGAGLFTVALLCIWLTEHRYLISNMALAWSAIFFLLLCWITESAKFYQMKRLSEKVLENKEDLLRQMDINAENSRVIIEIANALRSVPDVSDRFNRIAEITGVRLKYDRVMILIANEDETELCYRGGYGFTEKETAHTSGYRVSLETPSTGVFYETYKENKTILVNNINTLQQRSTQRSFRLAEIMNPRSFISCPIVVDETVIGIIVAGNIETPKKLGRNDKNLMMGVAQQIGNDYQKQKFEAQREALKNQQQHLQKMEALGVLAGGIAHDFNNLLTPIVGYTELCLRTGDSDNSLKGYLDEVHGAALRAKQLVAQILAFSRQENQISEAMEISPIVSEAVKFLQASLPPTIRFNTSIAENVGKINADPTRIHQVVMNLCTNAYHAMKQNGGVLTVSLADKSITSGKLVNTLQLTPCRYAVLTISDTGHGMNRATLEKIFEPYFTTKEKGEGTGLGLSITHGIVKQFNGHICVDSEPGKGTAFTVYLPQTETEVNLPEDNSPAPEESGTEKILVIDDEPNIAELLKEMLEKIGYTVTAHTDALEAMERFRSAPKAFDLVITDMTMPGISGADIATEILRLTPDIPVILCTGYSEIINDRKAQAIGIKAFLGKPISMKKLAATVRRTLDAKLRTPLKTSPDPME
ncbi:MAG: ATP-binding protein [Pseudomonadota bacterium]